MCFEHAVNKFNEELNKGLAHSWPGIGACTACNASDSYYRTQQHTMGATCGLANNSAACNQYINDNLWHANMKLHQYKYAPDHKVLKKGHDLTNMGIRTTDTYTIKQVDVIGTLPSELHWDLIEYTNICKVIQHY